jgi:hypothetical protein
MNAAFFRFLIWTGSLLYNLTSARHNFLYNIGSENVNIKIKSVACTVLINMKSSAFISTYCSMQFHLHAND